LCRVNIHFLKIPDVDVVIESIHLSIGGTYSILKVSGLQAHLQQFRDGFDLQGRPLRQLVTGMEFISDGS
jgi:hypothetical protein